MRSLIKWFVENPIAANLLMLAMLIGGMVGMGAIKKEVFPSIARNVVNINMPYPGAAPSEVEQQIVVRIEEAIANLPGIFQIKSQARQGSGNVSIEVIDGYDVKEILNDVKARIDAINSFPTSAERPIINQAIIRNVLMYMSLTGDADLSITKKIAYQIRDEMSLLEGISEVTIGASKRDEVSIEVPESSLRKYNLTFNHISTALRQSSLDVPAGTIKTEHGDIQIQTRSQAYTGNDFEKIVIKSNTDGSQLLLRDIAIIKDGFAEQDIEFTMKRKPGISLEVKISDDPQLFLGTKNAHEYIDELKKILPKGLELNVNFEMRTIFDSRFNLLKDNALSGLLLVFIVLMLFLRPLLAIWVVAGIVTTFAGAIWILPYFDVSLNMLSMFGFLMVLGIVVDDAIIVGESIYTQQHSGKTGKTASTLGTTMVLKPVFLAVISTIIFFLPMADVPSEIKPFTLSIFFVVMFCLIFSLVESLLILPSHLSHMKPEKPSRFAALKALERLRALFSNALENFAKNTYQPSLAIVLRNKASTYVSFFMIFALAISVFMAGWIKGSFFPNVPQEFIIINLSYPEGTPYSTSYNTANRIRDLAYETKENKDLIAQNNNKNFVREINKTVNGNNITVFFGLIAGENRTIETKVVEEHLRELIGPIPEAQSFSMNSSMAGGGPDIILNLSLNDNTRTAQESAVDDVIKTLSSYPGVINVRSDLDSERTEVALNTLPHAETMGVTLGEIATQVRQSFYGEEVQRIPRSKEDVKVMLRYPEENRRTLDTLDDMRIRTQSGNEIPLTSLAEIKLVPGSNSIKRTDRRRNIKITAEVEEDYDANEITTAFLKAYVLTWKKKYSGFSLSLDGNLKAQARFGDNFLANFIKVMFVVLAIFAIAFRSIFQPFIVMLAIPFGFVGAIIGHLIFGHDISMMSFFGFLACSGVVVNDNLVLLERINQLKREGHSVYDAVLNAGVDRFRPIILTSITTFVGLLPILFERSLQSQFLIPMVLSLSFGVMFSSFVTLFLVPCTYLGGYSFSTRIKALFSRKKDDQMNIRQA